MTTKEEYDAQKSNFEKKHAYVCPKCKNTRFFNNGWIGLEYENESMPIALPKPYGWPIIVCCMCHFSFRKEMMEEEFRVCHWEYRPMNIAEDNDQQCE